MLTLWGYEFTASGAMAGLAAELEETRRQLAEARQEAAALRQEARTLIGRAVAAETDLRLTREVVERLSLSLAQFEENADASNIG
ncbi:MAG: hypothetical protein FOGNACKC_00837 [Anaerolineae bacterium]|nr:hypothetical protein [Anaerolineae bacterium]